MNEIGKPVDDVQLVESLNNLEKLIAKHKVRGIHFCVEEGERVPSVEECLDFVNAMIPQGADFIRRLEALPTL